MKFIIKNIRQNLFILPLYLLTCFAGANRSFAQCSTSAGPTFAHSCLNEYFTSITASGTGVTSTIGVTGSSCTGTYFNYYSTQGITATVGSTVKINVSRYTTTYVTYLSVYVDWNNNGTYEATELAGSRLAIPFTTLSSIDSFVVPATCGVVTGTNLHMRVMLAESVNGVGAPCTADYGEACDFYINVGCSAPSVITVSPSSRTICTGGGVSPVLTASGAGAGDIYTWSPSSGLSATTGASVTANPAATTVYTVTSCSACGISTATSTITVLPQPGPVSGPSSVCP